MRSARVRLLRREGRVDCGRYRYMVTAIIFHFFSFISCRVLSVSISGYGSSQEKDNDGADMSGRHDGSVFSFIS